VELSSIPVQLIVRTRIRDSSKLPPVYRRHIIMEASSPLAAMQPPSFMPTWGRTDMYTSHPHSHMSSAFGPGAFNFRDLSMKGSRKSDYFTMKHVRGSSPTASLAADLSQNFHIDMRYADFIRIHLRASLTQLKSSIANTSPIALHIESFRDN